MNEETDQLVRFVRRSLRAVPDARICIAVLTTTGEETERVNFALTGNLDQVGDSVTIADQLLRHVSAAIARGLHPDCDVCRDRIKRIEAARAALEVEKPELAS